MNWFTDIEQAKEESKKSRKPILLQFEMENCGGCKKLYEVTYPNEKVQEEMNEWFVLLKLDLKKDREIRRELSGYWTPSFYFLDHNGKSYYNFNGYLPPEEFRLMLRIAYSESMIPKGKYDEVIDVTGKEIDSFKDSALLPKVLVQRGIAEYIKTKDNPAFRKTMKEIQNKYPHSLEAKMYFWED
ncbi:MAG: thioredoxin family protein [Melioribacteraceae bacterium]|nr:thioredoxin family protein [Melioribacteraceae bacterium]MCO6474219.1 thioredoxin family protein [Melioribacteraceae bacterium]